uniref:H15 domain-containing protein n=1 Tax=Heterosigma akashiwo TaxID=2829 RepID=A0A6V2U3J2_HETAK
MTDPFAYLFVSLLFQAIKKYIESTYKKITFQQHSLRLALKKGVEAGKLIKVKASYKISAGEKLAVKKASKPVKPKKKVPNILNLSLMSTVARVELCRVTLHLWLTAADNSCFPLLQVTKKTTKKTATKKKV